MKKNQIIIFSILLAFWTSSAHAWFGEKLYHKVSTPINNCCIKPVHKVIKKAVPVVTHGIGKTIKTLEKTAGTATKSIEKTGAYKTLSKAIKNRVKNCESRAKTAYGVLVGKACGIPTYAAAMGICNATLIMVPGHLIVCSTTSYVMSKVGCKVGVNVKSSMLDPLAKETCSVLETDPKKIVRHLKIP